MRSLQSALGAILSCGLGLLAATFLYQISAGSRLNQSFSSGQMGREPTIAREIVHPRPFSRVKRRSKREISDFGKKTINRLPSPESCSSSDDSSYPYCTYTLTRMDGTELLLNLTQLRPWDELNHSTAVHSSSLDHLFHYSPLVQYMDSNESIWSQNWTESEHCLFSGTVRTVNDEANDKNISNTSQLSPAVVNLCGGMGAMCVDDEVYFVEPLKKSRGLSVNQPHLLYRFQPETFHDDTWTAEASSQHSHAKAAVLKKSSDSFDSAMRKKRTSESNSYYIEVFVVADLTMLRYHSHGLENYILTLFSTVASIYRHPSLGADVNVVVVRILIIDHEKVGPVITQNAQETLRNFCMWQHSLNDHRDGSSNHHDVAILLTREDICRAPGKCDTLGLAELGTMCDSYRSCAIIEDNGLSAAFTIAHELGHIFNIPHDDEKKCANYMDLDKRNYHIMAPTLEFNTHPWSWSACSSALFQQFLELPGYEFDVDNQCKFVFGPDAKLCPYMPSCKRLWCATNYGYQVGCRTQHMPWADGTPCGHERWCFRGECVPLSSADRQLVDGGWGEWRAYGDCSRTCGGGVKKAKRECDNPRPMHGGRYCTGMRVRYKPCNTKECSWDLPGFREVQCSIFNNKPHGIYGVSTDATWTPQYSGISSSERCKLYCKAGDNSAFYMLKSKVEDGTPCGRYTDDMCVDGMCRSAGCDHRLGSGMKRDNCGVCGGNSSHCRRVKGSFNEQTTYGYNSIIRIPAGAANIDIRQNGYNSRKDDDNYLALRNIDGWILNGEFQVSVFSQEIPVRGTVLEYSGSDNIIERINSTGASKEDLFLHILSVGNLYPSDISYEYVVSDLPLREPQNRDFYWVLGEAWTPCSSPCQGQQEQTVVCVDAVNENEVDERRCASDPHRPTPERRACNINCHFKWETEAVSKCSATCGRGQRSQRSFCAKKGPDGAFIERTEDRYCYQQTKPSDRVACYEDCHGRRWTYAEWSECSATCGGGVRRRHASCLDKDGRRIDEDQCSSLPQESLQHACNRFQCPLWTYGEWSPCSHTCDGGDQRRRATCQDAAGRDVDAELCNQAEKHDWKRCNQHHCTNWDFGPWNQCSRTCGEAIATRGARCVNSKGEILDDSKCEKTEKIVRKPCRLAACPKWDIGDWSQCSRTCLDGWQERRVRCVDGANRVLDEQYCKPKKETKKSRPASMQPCNMGPCPFWKTGDWSACSISCGNSGRRQRSVECVYKEEKVDGSWCRNMVEPPRQENCQLSACPEWELGAWEQCPVSCGSGHQSRRVQCVFPDGGGPASDDKCNSRNRPKDRRHCKSQRQCPAAAARRPVRVVPTPRASTPPSANDDPTKWITGGWTQCSKTCGEGRRNRQVVCRDLYGRLLPDKYCRLSTKPKPMETCHLATCGVWTTGAWTHCTETCGSDGLRRRLVQCVASSAEESRLDRASCDDEERPVARERCPMTSCPTTPPRHDVQADTSYAVWRTGSWSQCSKSCGLGVRRRQVICGDVGRVPKCDRALKPATTESCQLATCGAWKTGQWSQCNVSCGGGIQFRRVQCNDRNTGGHIKEENCSRDRKPEELRRCSEQACARHFWRTGKWNTCSATCGRGVRSRTVDCVNDDGDIKEQSLCAGEVKPAQTTRCRIARCPRWRRSKWSLCSATCGEGVRWRTVACYEGRRKRAAPTRCAALPKPHETSRCVLAACPSYLWRATEWTRCSEVCKAGSQMRQVYCVNSEGLRAAPGMCPGNSKPPATRSCISLKCPYYWVPSHWSTCSKSCGPGQQYRSLHCRLKTATLVFHETVTNDTSAEAGDQGPQVPAIICQGLPKPDSVRQCSLGPCDAGFIWMVEPWSTCSASCGEGYQRRRVKCLKKNKVRVHRKRCNQQMRPKRRRKCFLRNCEGTDCAEIKSISGNGVADGFYKVLVSGYSVQVYCHDMNQDHPKTYIHLSHPDSNFAEIYGKRLLYPFTCPKDGERDENCRCTNEGDQNAGKTMFQRIRVDLHNMKIINDDFTFTKQEYGKQVPFGVAGDCYSAVNCPQGLFNIDLRGTGFRVAESSKWVEHGHRTFMQIQRPERGSVVVGKCGGYCGNCYPDKWKGLHIEVDFRVNP